MEYNNDNTNISAIDSVRKKQLEFYLDTGNNIYFSKKPKPKFSTAPDQAEHVSFAKQVYIHNLMKVDKQKNAEFRRRYVQLINENGTFETPPASLLPHENMVGARGRGGIDGFFGDGGCDPGDIDGPGDDIIGNFDSECLGYLFGSKVSELELLEAIEEFGPVEFKSKSRMELDPQYSLDCAIMDSEIDNLSYK